MLDIGLSPSTECSSVLYPWELRVRMLWARSLSRLWSYHFSYPTHLCACGGLKTSSWCDSDWRSFQKTVRQRIMVNRALAASFFYYTLIGAVNDRLGAFHASPMMPNNCLISLVCLQKLWVADVKQRRSQRI